MSVLVFHVMVCCFLFCLLFVCCSFITASYDRTCKVWDTQSGQELFTLEGHRNVVYSIAFNNPYGYTSSVGVVLGGVVRLPRP